MTDKFYCPWTKKNVLLSQEAKYLRGDNRIFPDAVQHTPLKCSKKDCTKAECICLGGNKDPRKK